MTLRSHRPIVTVMTCAAIIIAACQCRRDAPTNDPTGSAPPVISITGTPPVAPPSPTAAAPAPTPTSVKPSACREGMVEVEGTYCDDVEHLCLSGYPGIGSQWTEYPNGAKNITYCEHYVKGHAVCLGAQKKMHLCIDKYEYPNQAGELPKILVSWYDADRTCRAQGKRLCNEDEWTLACEGEERRPYPYGWDRDATACNLEKKYKKDIEPTGSRPRCVSPFGVYDITGNVDEWTRNVLDANPGTEHAPYVSIFKGGHMLGKVRNRCRPATRHHGPGYSDKTAGFRCCADPKAPTK